MQSIGNIGRLGGHPICDIPCQNGILALEERHVSLKHPIEDVNPEPPHGPRRGFQQVRLLQVGSGGACAGQRGENGPLSEHQRRADVSQEGWQVAEFGNGAAEAADGDDAAEPSLQDSLPLDTEKGRDLEERGGEGKGEGNDPWMGLA